MTDKCDYPLDKGKKCRNKAFKEVYYQGKDKETRWSFLCRKHFKQENAIHEKHPKRMWLYCTAEKKRSPVQLQGNARGTPKSWLKPGRCYSLDEILGEASNSKHRNDSLKPATRKRRENRK